MHVPPGWEISPINASIYWADVPVEQKSKMHYYNVPCDIDPESPFNPLNIVKKIYRCVNLDKDPSYHRLGEDDPLQHRLRHRDLGSLQMCFRAQDAGGALNTCHDRHPAAPWLLFSWICHDQRSCTLIAACPL